MIKKRFDIDSKNTMWIRTYIEITAETEEEMQIKVDNFDFTDSTSYTELYNEHLSETCEDVGLEENQYNPTMELFEYGEEGYKVVKNNLQNINKEDVKMFSINDIKGLWFACYSENLDIDYMGFYDELLKRVR
jgi:hypothetical protein